LANSLKRLRNEISERKLALYKLPILSISIIVTDRHNRIPNHCRLLIAHR